MSRILVTGAAGHVGTNLVRALMARGQQMRALVPQDTRALEGLDVEVVHGDVRDAESLAKAFSGVELVFHTAAEKAPKGERYILGGQRASVLELAKLGQEIAGSPAPRAVFPLWLMQAGLPFIGLQSRLSGKNPLYTRASLKAFSFNPQIRHEKATQELGYQPRPLRQTVIETLG